MVLKEYTLNENLYNIFVPAWGWVGSFCNNHKKLKYSIFRPRLGMGWFPEDIKSKMQYFRPRLGMGWFISISLYVIWFRDFRPRLGMGWFRAHGACTTDCQMFSSPLGDGVVHHAYQTTKRTVAFSSPVGDWWFNVEQIKDTCLTKFSSPPGDGLVPLKKSTKGKIEHIFVPEWGWVGSRWKNIYLIL